MSSFDQQYKVLNSAQKQAVDAIEGPVIVIAGPGTGKTTILTLRIANILKKTDTAPENILALTFTDSGANAMRRKLVEIIGSSAYKVNIHTFHGFAEKIIQEYPDYFARIIGSKLITDAEQIKIIEHLVKAKDIEILRPYGDPLYYIKAILNEIHIIKRENISPDHLIASVEKDITNLQLEKNKKEISKGELDKLEKRNNKNLELANIYERYEKELAKQKFYDFDDMLLELIRVMEKEPNFKLLLQENYQYILADEHQDANGCQNKILELLTDFYDSPNLFIVGDDKQAIYRFQGASLENFLYFSKKYPDAKVIELEHNYRSHQNILDASHSLIENNPKIEGYSRKKLISLQIGGKPIFVDEFVDKKEELNYLSLLIAKMIEKGEKPEEVAILYRENKEAKEISDILKSYGISNRIESDHDILNDIDALKIITLCRAIDDPSKSELLANALLLPELGCDPATLFEIFNKSNREHIPLHTILDKKSDIPKCNKDRLKEVYKAYSRIIDWSKNGRLIPFTDFLHRLIQETNMLASIVSASNSLERLASLEALNDRINRVSKSRKTFYLKDFIEYIDIVSNHGIMTKNSYVEHISGVRLMTAHRAKGLEFNTVFIINATDGTWGNRKSRNNFDIPLISKFRNSGRIEDERRLFYVALTRARKIVNISYSRMDLDGQLLPSQFIAEIDPSLLSIDKRETQNNIENIKKALALPKVEVNKQVSIFNKEFVKSKFLSQPLSVTHINNYLECPWRYFFVNLIRIPKSETKHQMYGTAIHLALKAFFDAYKEERDMNKSKLLDLFKYYLDREPLSLEDKRDSWQKGKKALEGYYNTYKGIWNRHLITEYSIKVTGFEIDELSLTLTGKLDKIEFMDQSNVNVIDYKTSKPKSRNEIEGKTKDADGNYKRQLVFYKLLLDLDKKYKMKYGEIDFVEPNNTGNYKKERFDITKEEVEELEELIIKIAKSVMELDFTDQGCGKKDCEYCRLARVISP